MAASTAWARRSAPLGLRLGASLDAVGAGAEIDAVEIELEDFRLAELVLEPERQHRLLHLAPERALLGEKQILGELLGEGRAALRHAAVQQVGGGGAEKPDGIDAVMAEEAPVLDRDEGPRQIGWKLFDRNIAAAHLAAHDQRSAVGADNLDGRRALGHFERLDRRQGRDGESDDAGGRDHRPDAEHQRPVDEPPQERAGAALAARRRLAARALGRLRRRGSGGAGAARSLSSQPHARLPAGLGPAVKLMRAI
jgi:hypothetical protein